MSSYPYRFLNLLSSAFAPQEPAQDQQALVGQADAEEEWPLLQEQTGQDPGLREFLPGAREYVVHPPSRVACPENQQQDQPQPGAGPHQRRPRPGTTTSAPVTREQTQAPTAAAAAGRNRSGRYHYVRDNMDRYICTFRGADGQPCEAAYYSHAGFCKHYQVNHEPKKLYPCRFCVRSLFFYTRAQYTQHMKRVHSA
ncbi:hypothetical protein ASPACDRAFT_60074 [Aspergillus aculeatus ATCC 16872]|uniref:Uncharacterized protein n=1 Tax=Aspergillus aculeatus (strain ATCC 16872 / CBS 172.66 / WB 5094) TaxID=690307 RepID=A0A1L9WVC6_ASPA1|nr:uncharacterized protein ASPACDRAFT_60074 [Aspergillus aculeatus ATCC 16872]OJK00225.1 hypothetical protein ASPACDRAFT_60074 [Aspergillus aculeatus ATCC 16872]